MSTFKNLSLCFVLVALLMSGCRCMNNPCYDDGSGYAGNGGYAGHGGHGGNSGYAEDGYSGADYEDGTLFGERRIAFHPDMPPYDRPFPLGQVSDAHTDTQQTNAEAYKFILYDHEFREVENTAGILNTNLTPDGKKHLTQIAVRLPHVPFPVVIEESEDPTVNELRRTNVVRWLCAFHQLTDGDPRRDTVQGRVVIAPSIEDGLRADEAIAAGYISNSGSYGGHGHGNSY